MINDTMLRLYLSGNLDRETAASVEAALSSDAELRARLEKMRAGEPSFSNQPVEAAAVQRTTGSPDGHLGATEEQVQPNVEPVAREPEPHSGSASDLGIDPATEITPG